MYDALGVAALVSDMFAWRTDGETCGQDEFLTGVSSKVPTGIGTAIVIAQWVSLDVGERESRRPLAFE